MNPFLYIAAIFVGGALYYNLDGLVELQPILDPSWGAVAVLLVTAAIIWVIEA